MPLKREEPIIRNNGNTTNFQKLTVQESECRMSDLPTDVNIRDADKEERRKTDFSGTKVNVSKKDGCIIIVYQMK